MEWVRSGIASILGSELTDGEVTKSNVRSGSDTFAEYTSLLGADDASVLMSVASAIMSRDMFMCHSPTWD